MDAFFASLEERASPQFKGLPIVVGSDPKKGKGRGVVSTANYLAREYGIHSALPITRAWQLSQNAKAEGKPEVVFLPVNFDLYVRSSNSVYKILKKHSPIVEPASIDEFYFDLTFAKSYKKAKEIAEKIRAEILKKEKVTCSIGIGPNKLISKIAAGVNKPSGFLSVAPKDVLKFLATLKVQELPGIGPKTTAFLNEKGIFLIRDLRKIKKSVLSEWLHKNGEGMYYKARGIDNSELTEEREVKSIGEQRTFLKDTLNSVYINHKLKKMCDEVFERFLESGFKSFKTIALVVRFSNFWTINSAKSFKEPLTKDNLRQFKLEALKLILPFFDKRKNPKLQPIRLIGIRIEKFENS